MTVDDLTTRVARAIALARDSAEPTEDQDLAAAQAAQQQIAQFLAHYADGIRAACGRLGHHAPAGSACTACRGREAAARRIATVIWTDVGSH